MIQVQTAHWESVKKYELYTDPLQLSLAIIEKEKAKYVMRSVDCTSITPMTFNLNSSGGHILWHSEIYAELGMTVQLREKLQKKTLIS